MSEEVGTEEVTTSEVEQTPEVTETPEPEIGTEPTPEVPPVEGEPEPLAAEAPAYEPNLKFNVHNEEHAIDEMYKSLMTDAEKEAAIRSLHEKAYGLDKIKPKYAQAREKIEQFEPLQKKWEQLNESYNKKDYETFFKGLGVDDEAIYAYAQKRLDYDNLTPEEKANYDRITSERSEYYTLQQEVQQLRATQTDYAAQARGSELDTELARPEVAVIVEKYDSVHGSGAFRNLAIDTGESAFKSTGVDYGARDVVGHLQKQYAPFVPKNQPASASTAQQGRPLVVPAKKDAIPNLQGQSTSPVRQEIRSLADLKKVRESLPAEPQGGGSYRTS